MEDIKMTITINNSVVHIVENRKTGCVVGEFINDSTKPKIYGDTLAEVIDQAEDIANGR